jgi:hypothetical protein
MKLSKADKREMAVNRAKNYVWENSRAKRLGTKTQEQWEKSRLKYIADNSR